MTDDRSHLALDGELDAAAQIAFERAMAERPEDAVAYKRLKRLSFAVREHAERDAAPERLRLKLERLSAPARTRASWRPALPAAMAAALAVVCALGGYRAGLGERGDATLAALVAGHERATLSGQPFDVASSDRHTVKPWLAARAPLGAFVPDLSADGFTLIGGRLEILDRRPAPTAVYKRREHVISVVELPLSDAAAGATEFEGYHVARWADSERAYIAISDLDAGELGDFEKTFVKAAEQAKPPKS